VKVAGDVEDELDCEVVSEVELADDEVDCEDVRKLVVEAVLALLEVLELVELVVDVVLVETVEEVEEVLPLRAANAPTAMMITTMITTPIMADRLIARRNLDLNRDIK
jgi:hypothetical protein